MITISREKKEILDSFGSYRIVYNLENLKEKKRFKVTYNAKDDDFEFDSDFYKIETNDNEFYWKKKGSKFEGFLNKELIDINGVKELLRFLFVNEESIEVTKTIFDNEFHPNEFKKFCKKNDIDYNYDLCYNVWKEYYFFLSNKQMIVEEEMKNIEKSLRTTKREDYKNELFLRMSYLKNWREHNDNKKLS